MSAAHGCRFKPASSLARLARCTPPHTERLRSAQVVKNSKIIFIATKPQYVKVVLAEVKDILTPEHIIVSIAAGVPIAALKVRKRISNGYQAA